MPALAPPPSLSVVVPTHNEALRIAATLRSLLGGGGGRLAEIVVVDSGSGDGTVELVRAHDAGAVPLVLLENVSGGRGVQLAAGARAARRGDVLLFVHADALLPPRYAEDVAAALQDGKQWGAWECWAPRVGDGDAAERDPCLAVIAYSSRWRSRLLGIAYGDQGMFVRRDAYHRVGGFPPWPLLEDLHLSRVLRSRYGLPSLVPVNTSVVRVSTRRFRQLGSARTCLLNNLYVCLWRLGCASPRTLARWYYARRT